MNKQIILLGLLFLAIVSQLASYGIPSLAARIILITVFSGLLLVLVAFSRTGRKSSSKMRFAVLLVISMCFTLQRYHLLLPDHMEAVAHSESFLTAEYYKSSGSIQLDFVHSFLVQSPMLLCSLSNVSGIPLTQTVYIALSLHTILVALIGVLSGKIAQGALNPYLPALVSFLTISFLNSERADFGLLLIYLLLCYLFKEGSGDRRKAIVSLVLILGFTVGSATSILVAIPFFFLFAVFRSRGSSLAYSLIPLTYLVNTGYPYLLSLKGYFQFSLEGLSEFLHELIRGSVPTRIVPWQRSSVPTVGDVQVTSMTYVSILLLSAIMALTSLYVCIKERKSRKCEKNALFLSMLIVLLMILGVALFVYVGASVKPETSFSDIRTITVAHVMVLLPFLFSSTELLRKITARKIAFATIAALMILSSLRTFYDRYPKSSYDPINVVEDMRVDPFSVHRVGDFLGTFHTKGYIAFDYKTAPELRSVIFTKWYGSTTTVAFDINGLRLGSLYISPDEYRYALNLTLTQNTIYSSGNVVVVQWRGFLQ